MNKFFLITVILISIESLASATESESWLFLGGEYSKFYESSSDGTTTTTSTIDSIGVNFSGFTFWNKSEIGLYSHASFLFPQFGTLSLYGETSTVDLTEYDFLMSISLIIGPGFRKEITNTSTFYSGIGLHFFNMSGSNKVNVYPIGTVSYGIIGFNLGLGGDLGLKLDIFKNLSISVGTSLTYDFYNYTLFNSSIQSEVTKSIPTSYSAFMINPYICFVRTSFKGRSWQSSE